MVKATVITDASYKHSDQTAGWAAWIRIDGRAEPIKRYGAFSSPIKNSTVAEKKAALNGMSIAVRHGAAASVPFLFKQWEGESQKVIKAKGRALDGVVHDAYPTPRVTQKEDDL